MRDRGTGRRRFNPLNGGQSEKFLPSKVDEGCPALTSERFFARSSCSPHFLRSGGTAGRVVTFCCQTLWIYGWAPILTSQVQHWSLRFSWRCLSLPTSSRNTDPWKCRL